MTRNTTSRTLHDLGLSAWFGGTLANAVALNPAAGAASDPSDRGTVVNEGWDRWTPVNLVAIGAHLVGAVGQLAGNQERISAQPEVRAMSLVKTALTAAALGATAYSRVLGKKVSVEREVPVASGTSPTFETPDEVASAQKQLRQLQWVIPALTGALIAVSALAGEQQRDSDDSRKGVLARLRP